MAWSGSNFVRALGATQWQNDAAAAVGIVASIHDTQDNDLASGIDACINKNGANTPTTNLSMGGFVHTNVGNATARTNYAQVGQVQDGTYLWGGTSGGSANAQTITLTPAITGGTSGQVFYFKAGFTNTAATTLNINGLGTTFIVRADGIDLYPGDITAGNTYQVINNGASKLILIDPTPTWNSWVPTTTPSSGSVGVVSYPVASYIVHLGKLLTFELAFNFTLSGGPANSLTLTLPLNNSTGAAAFPGSYLIGGVRSAPQVVCSSSTQIQVNPPSGSFANGTYNFIISGSYRAA